MGNNTLSWQEQLALISENMPRQNDEMPDVSDANSDKGVAIAERCGKISIFYEKKGRGGKQATIITGFDNLSQAELADLASEIKKRLATGGSVRGGEILVQGDRRKEVAALLKAKGFKGCNI